MSYRIDLSGRVALVTGASSGLGLQFAKTLAGAGAAVVLAGRRVERLTTRAYNEVDTDFARAEGEDDLSLASWREGHKRFFTRTLAIIGKEFKEDMPLICERFRVIHK